MEQNKSKSNIWIKSIAVACCLTLIYSNVYASGLAEFIRYNTLSYQKQLPLTPPSPQWGEGKGEGEDLPKARLDFDSIEEQEKGQGDFQNPSAVKDKLAKEKFLLQKQREIEAARQRPISKPIQEITEKQVHDLNKNIQDNAIDRQRELRYWSEKMQEVNKWADLGLKYVIDKIDKGAQSRKVTWMFGNKTIVVWEKIKINL